MKKGFTLIELLAVLAILAVIAMIAVPQVLNLISDSRKESAELSVKRYMDAIEIEISNKRANEGYLTLDGTYVISDNGETLTRNDGTTIKPNYDGNGIEEGSVIIKDGVIIEIINGKIDKWQVQIVDGEINLSD